MEILEYIKEISSNPTTYILAASVATIFEVSKIKISPWTWLFSKLGKAINGELLKEIDNLKKEINEVKQKVIDLNNVCDERNATLNRTHILHFNDEILHQKDHTKEHFDQILEDIDDYDDYCKEHPLYKNNKAVSAINNIKRTYDKCMEKNNFL